LLLFLCFASTCQHYIGYLVWAQVWHRPFDMSTVSHDHRTHWPFVIDDNLDIFKKWYGIHHAYRLSEEALDTSQNWTPELSLLNDAYLPVLVSRNHNDHHYLSSNSCCISLSSTKYNNTWQQSILINQQPFENRFRCRKTIPQLITIHTQVFHVVPASWQKIAKPVQILSSSPIDSLHCLIQVHLVDNTLNVNASTMLQLKARHGWDRERVVCTNR
jgi:hypothetical protein